MGQIVVRQLDDRRLARLKSRAKAEGTSVEALARDAIHRAAGLTAEDRVSLAERMLEAGRRATIADSLQTPSIDLIREDRDRDH